jgi:hypothetical protein
MRRGTTIEVRVSDEEKAEITRRAEASGYKPGPYIRALGLGEIKPPRAAVAIAAGPSIKEPKEEAPRRPPQVEAEIEESKLEDGEAHEAFVARRTKELFTQGKTTPLARQIAEAEWRQR